MAIAANLALYAVVVVTPTAATWAILKLPGLIEKKRANRRIPEPSVEQLAADLRRVHRLLADYGPGIPAARRLSARQAYDALLVQACAAVRVKHHLDDLPEGMEREIERLTVAESLRKAGLRLTDS
ncbi:hypothetical protein SAMN05421504_103341 [Amycolatopsis xylanica]|uniref:Uncharacterized protein n=1 Tax=Amycolatopsis xylanica TaxID=589385 RepID=A0A1H3DCV2_9PSEU|nr:hypothetical protein [Amycolatopsis xylanica]SDX64211.1 hypothetical protein SAMN05421504_103341 [Amycolatopsis xylanica]